MEYEIFERDFIFRTLKIIEQYETHISRNEPPSKKFEVTLLINCLLGLLVLPKEYFFEQIPALPLAKLEGWGISATYIKSWGIHSKNLKKQQFCTLFELVYRMRNSVCHLRVKPQGNGKEITKIEFSDLKGFSAVVPVSFLKDFVTKLAQSVIPYESCDIKLS